MRIAIGAPKLVPVRKPTPMPNSQQAPIEVCVVVYPKSLLNREAH